VIAILYYEVSRMLGRTSEVVKVISLYRGTGCFYLLLCYLSSLHDPVFSRKS